MTTVGQKESNTQQRVAKFFQDTLGYQHLGNFHHQESRNIMEGHLERFLLDYQGCEEAIAHRAIQKLIKTASNSGKSLYDRNKEVYSLLRYGIKIKPEDEGTMTIWPIDWKEPERNRFAIAEEVTVKGFDAKSHDKRPDIVLYVNGIALGVLELKRSTVSVSEAIRQNLDNQKKLFIQQFFSTMQLVMAGNDSEGLRYGTIETPEKYYLTWKEEGHTTVEEEDTDYPTGKHLDDALYQMCRKDRLLELIHDFTVFDAGTKKLCRHNQYFGVRAAQEHIKRREGGIIWYTQGSGKSLTMVWLAKWIRENVPGSRVLLITDRTELDEQIEKVFDGVDEEIYRTASGADLLATLDNTNPWLICSLVHKFGKKSNKGDGQDDDEFDSYVEELKQALSSNFSPKGEIFVFVDECHRTQSGKLHKAMTALLPNALFIGFTGTPLLKADKQKSIEVFGGYIHTYKFDEAVGDGVVLDLLYEARDIEQYIKSPEKIDKWFEAKTKGLTDLAKAQLKKRWGTIQKVLSSQDRLDTIVSDIMLDMEERDRLCNERGNAMLVSGSIYQACKYYELFVNAGFKRCAIITSYKPTAASIKGEESGEGKTERLRQYKIYRQMIADWFNEPIEEAPSGEEDEKKRDKIESKVALFEKQVKDKFIKEPGQMKLLIVVDKLLTGFDAPPATYLYIDKHMRDHGLFQAICRVNRLDGEDKDYGYIIDYKDLFQSLEGAIKDYTSGAFGNYDKEDVEGLLANRLTKAKTRLEDAIETMRALCEPVETPRDDEAYYRFFSSAEHGNAEQLKENEPRRLKLYKFTSALVRAYANLANEMEEAGFTKQEVQAIKLEVDHFENLRKQVKLHAGDVIDLKQYEPAMRHLIDSYIKAEDSEVVSTFDDISLVQLIVEQGAEAVEALPKNIKESEKAVAETIENNVRKLIIDETPVNPRYYEKMSDLLDALLEQRKQKALEYHEYLEKIIQLTKEAKSGPVGGEYPKSLTTPAMCALYDNLGKDENLALAVHQAVRNSRMDDWRNHKFKLKKVKLAIKAALGDDEQLDDILELVTNQNEY